ncbi:MAG: UPF0175 family protein [archaeon]
MALENISIRLEKTVIDKIELLSTLDYMDKSAIYRKALDIGLKEISTEIAIKKFVDEEFSIGEGAKLCDMYVGEFMELLAKRGIKQNPLDDDTWKYLQKNVEAEVKRLKQEKGVRNYINYNQTKTPSILSDIKKKDVWKKNKTKLKK